MCYTPFMDENVKPEVQVIAKTLGEIYPASSSSFMHEAADVWDELITYWHNRGKTMETNSPQYTEPALPDGATLVMGGGPYVHGGTARTFDFPSSKSELDEHDDIPYQMLRYKLYIENRLVALREDLYDITEVPNVSKTQIKQIKKALEHLDKAVDFYGED